MERTFGTDYNNTERSREDNYYQGHYSFEISVMQKPADANQNG